MIKEYIIGRDHNKEEEQSIYSPLFYRLTSEKDKARFVTLLSENDQIVIFDQILSQLQEFIKLSNPTKRISEESTNQLIKEHIGNIEIEEYGVWVYYPWSSRLVHILDEEEFIEVRTSRNQHKITHEEQCRLRERKIGVIGLSVGQSVSVTLSIERICGELRIADFDVLELSNLNRIRTGLHNLGIKKTISVAREIAEIDPFMKVICYHEGINEENIHDFLTQGGKLDILIDECDGLDVKVMCRQKAKALNIPVVMEASDRGTVDVERFDLEPNRSILHGYIDHLDVSSVKNLRTNEEKIPYLLAIAGGETISDRAKASMLEIGQTITTWPQLGSAVTYGGGITADVCRRILLEEFKDSGRYFIDLEELIKNNKKNNEGASINKVNLNPTLSEESMVHLISESTIRSYENELLLTEKLVTQLVEASIMAPSFSNAQPWKWKYDYKKLYLFSDIIYHSHMTNCKGSTSYIGLGAATENLVLKAHSLGLEIVVDKFPLKNNSTIAAVFTFFPKGYSPKENNIEKHIGDELVDFIPLRATNRKVTERKIIDKSILADLQSIVKSVPGADLKFIDEGSSLYQIGQIIGKMERIWMTHEKGHQDFIYETKWTPEQAEIEKRGIDIHSIDLPPGQIASLQMAKSWEAVSYLNKWGKGKGLERFPLSSVVSASAIGLITMPDFSLTSFYEGGRAVQRVWLEATKKNISFQPVTISTLIFNTFLYDDNKELFSSENKENLLALREQFQKIYSIENSVGEVMLFRAFISGKPEKKSLRVPVNKVLSFRENGMR